MSSSPAAPQQAATLRALHAVAELVIAGPQYEQFGDIRLTVRGDGIGGWVEPATRVCPTELITERGRFPLRGRLIDVASAAGITPRSLRDVYQGGPDFSPDESLDVDPAIAAVMLRAFADGDAALRAFCLDVEPILWPEHFDIGIAVDGINYGASPGDDSIAVPYAYVAPWEVPTGPFWNQPFGAARSLHDLTGTADIVAFFEEGRTTAAT